MRQQPSMFILKHPSKTAISAVLKLTSGQRDAEGATLTLQESGSLLTHLRNALAVALAPKVEELRTGDRQLLWDAMAALQHLRGCGACGEDSWESCSTGGQHAAHTLAAIELALVLPLSVDAIDPVGETVTG